MAAVYMYVRCDDINLGRTNRKEELEDVKVTSTGAGWDGFSIACHPPSPPPTKQRPGAGARRISTVITAADGESRAAATIRIIMSQ